MQVKKMRILTSVFVPITALAIAGSFVATCVIKKPINPLDNKDFTVSFDAGEGKFVDDRNHSTRVYANTHLFDVEQPAVIAQNKMFSGWVDSETKQPLLAKTLINKNTKLTATYSERIGEYASVTFSAGSTGAILHGNVNIAVNKGYYFFMINRPCVKLENKIFKSWVYANGPSTGLEVKENDLITQDVTLVPSFEEAIVMTWNGTGATKIRGSDTSTVKSDSLFKTINQPVYEKEGFIFAGWFKDDKFKTPWEESSVVSADSTAYAKWVPVSTTQCIINYVQKPGTDVEPIFAPSNSQIVSKNSTHWAEVFKPQVSTTSGDYKVGGWEYSLNGTDNWQDIPSDMQFSDDNIYIAPKMVPLVENIYISGPDKVVTQKTADYKAYIIGAKTQTVTWDVYDEKPSASQPHPAPSSHASIDKNQGILTVDFESIEGRKIYIQATSTIKENGEYVKSEPYEVEVMMPYIDSNLVWYYEQTANESNWYSAEPLDLSKKLESTFTATSLKTGTTSTVDKSIAFENKLFIGRTNEILPQDFLCNFTGFNGEIDFEETYSAMHSLLNSKNNIKVIGDSFLEGCKSFNKKIHFSSNIQSIGNNFLCGCKAFNNGSNTDNAPLDMKASIAKQTGNNFLCGCEKFNQQVILPGSIEELGDSFMCNCLSYNKTINLLSSINKILPFFMYNCRSFTGTIVIDCINFPSTFLGTQQQICAVSPTYIDPDTGATVESPIYKLGFNVSGAFAEQFKAKFKNMDDADLHVYRTSSVIAESHNIVSSTVLTSMSVATSKATIDDTQTFDLIVTNNRTDELVDGTVLFQVGSQKFYENIGTLPAGETRITYSKAKIDALLKAHGLSPMSRTDDITITLNRIGSYSILNNKLYKVDENGQNKLVPDNELSSLAGKFLIKNNYNEYRMNTQTLTEYIDSCAFGSDIDLVFLYGEYYIGNYAATTGQLPKNLTIHGILNSVNTKVSEFRIVSNRNCPTANLDARGLKFDIYNIKLLGILKNTTKNDWLNNCMISNKLHCTNCYLEGAFTLHNTDASFVDCVFDNRMVAFDGESQYGIFNYGSENAVFENCYFYNCGKAFKLYALNMIGHDATSTLSNCHFIYDTTQVVGKVPGYKCPLDIDATQLTKDKFYINLTGCTMSNYPSSITTLYSVKGAEHCEINVIS